MSSRKRLRRSVVSTLSISAGLRNDGDVVKVRSGTRWELEKARAMFRSMSKVWEFVVRIVIDDTGAMACDQLHQDADERRAPSYLALEAGPEE